MQTDLFCYESLPRRRRWSEAGGMMFFLSCSVSQCSFRCIIMLITPKLIYKGWHFQDSLQSCHFMMKQPYHHRVPCLPLLVHIRWRSALVHLTFLSHDLTSPPLSAPGAWTSFFPGNKELLSHLVLSSFHKTYMLDVLPSLQMSVTLQQNPFLLFPQETCYLYVK